MNINLRSTFICCREVIPYMIKRKLGRIVNFTSSAVPANSTQQMAYLVAKAGVVALTRGLAKDLLSHGIFVNAIGPGLTDTRVWHGSRSDDLKFEDMVKQTPMGRALRPEEIAEWVAFLSEVTCTTGQAVYVNGGSAI
jgi:3-oxoacyl-[acyl-carrier protein] reductase